MKVKSATSGLRDILPFVQIFDISEIIPILKKRLPQSCFIYNAVKMYSRFPSHTFIYVLNDGDELTESSWIVLTHYTENYGENICISAPKQEDSKISKEKAIEIFSESNLIEWDKPYWFIGLEKWISQIMYEISVNQKGNAIEVHPEKHFYMEKETCTDFNFTSKDSSVELKRLDSTSGTEFLVKTWKYTKDGTQDVVQRFLENNISAGVYVNKKPVSGVVENAYGLLCMLYTDKEHRKKGYAKFCMQSACKELIQNDLIPSSSAEVSNKPSIAFHLDLGFKVIGIFDWIYYTPPEF